MKIADIDACGIFDTAIAFPMQKRTKPRLTDCFEIELVISCEGSSVIDGVSRRLSPQNLLVVCPGRRRMTNLRYKCYFIHFMLPEGSEYRALLEQAPTCLRLIDNAVYRDLFEDLVRHTIAEEGSVDDDYTCAKLIELFYHIGRDSERSRELGESIPPRVNEVVSSAVEYMERNFASDVTLGELAASSDYSPNHFHRIFRACMGTTPQKYLLELRVRHAKYMLAQGVDSLSEIAYACGFSSQAYFGSIFRRATGLTPGEYRRFCMSSYSDGRQGVDKTAAK